ncbi:hypothetical protein HGA92_04920 [Candidatus Gracilibacteria bacterium]|nr:hypothetical protein [Candidatus Gracilibacteria bacterium]NUJ98423.1 hypothetical protein [Candidatus Gracilibacteria bacterium]
METGFIIKFNKFLRKGDWLKKEESKKLCDFFESDKENNELFLVERAREYSIESGEENKMKFYILSEFFKYLGEEHNFSNDKIISILKERLEKIIENNNFREYSYTLEVLFSINKEDMEYYINQYDLLIKNNSLYHDINAQFLTIFIKLKINDKFIRAFQKVIIDNTREAYFYSVKEGFKYLFSLNNSEFKKYFLQLLDFFSKEQNKEKLVHYHEYTSLIRSYDKKDFIEIFKNFNSKLDNANFSEEERKKIKEFLIGDIDFAINKFERNLTNNFFINQLFLYFYEKDNIFLIEILQGLNAKHLIFSLDKFVSEYLSEDFIEDFIQLYRDTDNVNLIYFIYDIAKNSGKEILVKSFEKSSFEKKIKDRNKQIEKNNEKYEKEKKERIEKEKKEFFSMLNPEKGHYYPKIFQDYHNYISNKEGLLEKTFSKQEIQEINISIRKQIKTLFEILKTKDYQDEKIVQILTFEKTGENSYSHTWYATYLSWIIDIAKYLTMDLSDYYKIFVLFYPLLWGGENIENILAIISKKINKDDIDYILRVYSEDLHENAIGLRYYHIDILTDFYNKFKVDFSPTQKKKLEEICLDVIDGNEENNIYYKKDFLKIYSEIGGEKKLLKLWNNWGKNFQKFNYFKDFLDNPEEKKEQKDKMKFFTFITQELAKTYGNKEALKWFINQLKNGKVEAKESFKIEYPRTSTHMAGISDKESELGKWGSNDNNFSFIFSVIAKIDILDEMLEILDLSFQIVSDLQSGKLKGNYEMYADYLRRIFYEYIENLDESLVYKDYYYKVKKLLDKYDYKVTYNFNLEPLKKKFGIDDLEEEALEIIEKDGVEGIKKLLKEKYSLQDENASLKMHPIQTNDTKDKDFILFVEGISDIIILQNAWEKLRENKEMPFRIENGYHKYNIGEMFRNKDYPIMYHNPNKTIIGMLDFDSAYNEFNGLNSKNNWEQVISNESKGLLKRNQKFNKGYIFLLPVPNIRKEYASSLFGDKSILSIEMLFEDKIILNKNKYGDYIYVEELKIPGNHKNVLFGFKNDKKKDFADTTNTFSKEEFKNFEHIFKLMEDIISGKYEK